MHVSGDSMGIAHPREILACDEMAATGPRRVVEDDLREEGTWHGLSSPTGVAQPVDRRALMHPVRRRLVSPRVGRISETMLSLGIVAAVGFVPIQGLLQTSSVDAVINARVTTLRAPTNGEVQPGPNPVAFGTSVARGDVLLRFTNRRADRSRVDDLTHQIAQVKDERSGIAARLANARMLLNDLTEQRRLFAEALQLEVRQGELNADVAAARARTEEAKTSLDRFTTLASKGWLPRAQLNQAKRDGLVAEKLEAAAQNRLEAVGIELAAAQRGVFVGEQQ
jgi:multidrug resistance efflux pump